MYNREFTPSMISALRDNEVFVFGSNLAGAHGGGAARAAYRYFGAVWGKGVGLQGSSYAIPTMQGGTETIKPYVDEFIEFAREHGDLKFLVTPIGCGIAGFTANQIAPLFAEAIDVENIILPKSFVSVLEASTAATPDFTWNAQDDFLTEFTPLHAQLKSGDSSNYYKIKGLRVKEFRNTVDIVSQGHYVTEGGVRYDFPPDDAMLSGTKYYNAEIAPSVAPAKGYDTVVEVRDIDCLIAAMELRNNGMNPAILNMACRSNPGGGVTSGAGAQEETLFRRTNLFRSLYQFAPYASQYGVSRSPLQYPLDRDFGGIYTPDAIYFRDSEFKGYALLDNPVTLSFITVAAINRPEVTRDGMIAPHLVDRVKNKIRTIFRMGVENGHDSLVLSAFGCGAFHNPPRHMAKLFHEVMNEPEFARRFRHIVFAIFDDHNSHRPHNPEGNFIPFKEEFSTQSN